MAIARDPPTKPFHSRLARGSNLYLRSVMSGPPSKVRSRGDRSLRRGPDVSSQPFSRCVGRTPRRAPAAAGRGRLPLRGGGGGRRAPVVLAVGQGRGGHPASTAITGPI